MKYRSAAILVILLTLVACATTPSRQFLHTKPDSETKIGQATRIAIIADVCLMRDVLGDEDYWVIQESQSAAGHMLAAAKAHLADKGYEISYAQAPFVGAFKNREKLFKVSHTSGEEVTEKIPPLF